MLAPALMNAALLGVADLQSEESEQRAISLEGASRKIHKVRAVS
jgi:hypothetical protein